MNSVVLVGNISRDIELRYSAQGTAFANTALAVNKKYKNQQGNSVEKVMFIDIKFYGKTAEVANQYLRKGSKLAVKGELELEQWATQDGQKRSKHVVNVDNMEMLSSGQQNSDSNGQQQQGGGYQAPAQGQGYQPPAQNQGYQPPAQNQGYQQPTQQQQYSGEPPVDAGYQPH